MTDDCLWISHYKVKSFSDLVMSRSGIKTNLCRCQKVNRDVGRRLTRYRETLVKFAQAARMLPAVVYPLNAAVGELSQIRYNT